MSEYEEFIRQAREQLQRAAAEPLSADQRVEVAKVYALLAVAEAIMSKELGVTVSTSSPAPWRERDFGPASAGPRGPSTAVAVPNVRPGRGRPSQGEADSDDNDDNTDNDEPGGDR